MIQDKILNGYKFPQVHKFLITETFEIARMQFMNPELHKYI